MDAEEAEIPVNEIVLSEAQMYFYEKNVIHDIIHDYGFYSAVTRWVKNINNLKYFVGGGGDFTIFIDNTDDDKDVDDGQDGGMETGTGKVSPPSPTSSSFTATMSTNVQRNLNNQQQENISGTNLSERFDNVAPNVPPIIPPSVPRENNNNINDLSRLRKLTRSINTEFVSALKNFFVLNLFEALTNNSDYFDLSKLEQDLPTIKKELDMYKSTKAIENVAKEESDNNMVEVENVSSVPVERSPRRRTTTEEEQLNFDKEISDLEGKINYYEHAISDDDTKSYKELLINDIFFSNLNFFSYYDESDSKLPDLYDDINIQDIIYISRKNGEAFNTKLSEPKKFDFIKLLERVQSMFKKIGLHSDFKFELNYLFVRLTDFLDVVNNDNGLNIINDIIFEIIRDDNAEQPVATQLDLTGGGKQEIKDLLTTIKEFTSQDYEGLKTVLKGIPADEERGKNLEDATRQKMLEICENVFKMFNDNIGSLNDNRKHKLEKTLATLTKQIEKLERTYIVFFRRIPPVSYDTFIDNKIAEIQKEMFNLLNPSLKVFEEELKEIELREKKEIDEKAKIQRELETGGLGDKKIVQENFLTAVAKLGLFLNGIEPVKGEFKVDNLNQRIRPLYNTAEPVVQELVLLETKILNYYANGCVGRPSYRDLDTALFYAFESINDDQIIIQNNKLEYKFNDTNYMCRGKGLYMIDNAAALNTNRRKNTVFCPLTSIVDGMGQCTLGSEGEYGANNIEFGDMNFSVKNPNNSAYYKGSLTLKTQGANPFILGQFNHATYKIRYKGFGGGFPTGINPEVSTTIEIPIINAKIKDLEAHNALKRTLVNILKIIQDLYTSTDQNDIYFANYLTSGGDVFSNIVDIITKPTIELKFLLEPQELHTNENELNNNLLQAFFTILGKGAGDIFQEINSICKIGGYIGEPVYLYKEPIMWWNGGGNGVRFFAAKDRPSAARFMFLTWFGQDDQINISSAGGFISETKEVLVTRNANFKNEFCKKFDSELLSIKPSTGRLLGSRGGSNKTKKYKREKKPKRTKRYNQTKKARKTRKYKRVKRPRKTIHIK